MTNEERIDRYLRNECTADELQEFKQLLDNDTEFGKDFVTQATEVAQIIEVAQEMGSTQSQPADRNPRQASNNNLRLFVFAIAGAAAVALAFLLAPTSSNHPIAVLTNSVAAQWPAGSNHLLGATLAKGRLQLDKGFVELSFNSGPRLILEGPAELELIDGQQARLLSGRLVARIPKQAIGFKIDTPHAQAVDQGTEFGMIVNKTQGTEIHVLEGLVDVNTPMQKTTKRLGTREALEISAQTSKKTTAAPQAFMRILPPESTLVPPYVHWSFDNIEGATVPDEGSGINGQHYPARLASINNGQTPDLVDGMINQAVYFDGSGTFVETDFPGVADGASRTVAFWVKVPTQTTRQYAYAMLSWGSFEHYGATWQISWNSEKEDGLLGRLRAGVHGGQVIGTHDLRDGRWHHVAVVLFGGNSVDVGTHVLLYLDGELETTSAKSVQAIKTDTGPKAKTVHMGRNAGFDHNKPFFRGYLDDVIISNEALSQDQIRSIMKKGGGALRGN